MTGRPKSGALGDMYLSLTRGLQRLELSDHVTDVIAIVTISDLAFSDQRLTANAYY